MFIVDADLGLFAVLDGMGGHAAGEIAAQIASDTLTEFTRRHVTTCSLSRRELLKFAIDQAGAKVYDASQRQRQWNGMGSTVVACLVDAASVVIGHVGDSRAYLLRDGQLQALTRDHTKAQQYVDSGALSAEVAERSSFRNFLTRNLGHKHGAQADMREVALQAGDRIMLCSDGLYDCVPRDVLQHVLASSEEPRQMARALINAALASEVNDNVSAVVLDVRPE